MLLIKNATRDRKPKFVPVIFHNLSGYDAHLFVKSLGSENDANIDCIPSTEEQYISFSKGIYDGENGNKKFKCKIRFVDSFKFMSTRLDKFVGNLNGNGEKNQFKHIKQAFNDKQCEFLANKGVFPYDRFDSFERLSETKLPEKEAFYSMLNDSDISNEDYERAQKVWKHFDMKTMRDYHDLYLKTDVLLLAEVFENFRSVCKSNYDLDRCWYLTAPGLEFDSCLKKTGVKHELLNDPDMLLMIKKVYVEESQ